MSKHNEHSSYREKLIEHLFIGELLKLSWLRYDCDLEVSKPEVDNAGYDVILEANRVVRHVQLKASHFESSTSTQKLHIKLGDKLSGCVVWILFNDETLELGPFLFFGNDAGEPLLGLDQLKPGKHTKANSQGEKAERPNIRVVNKGQFEKLETISDVYQRLFISPAINVIKANETVSGEDQIFSKLHKIKLWSEKPHQHNHYIVKAFLSLAGGDLSVSYLDFKEKCERDYGLEHFDGHFNSMMTDAGNAHGKVFYREHNRVYVWPRAMTEIQKYFR
jgi:hypothetical protein